MKTTTNKPARTKPATKPFHRQSTPMYTDFGVRYQVGIYSTASLKLARKLVAKGKGARILRVATGPNGSRVTEID